MHTALAIETSGKLGSIALTRDGELLAEHTFEHGLKHAAEILPIIDRLTRAQSLSPRQIDELYVSAGPGSFTGLRIGITLAKTLAFALGTKIVAVPTLRVLAENAPPEAENLILVLDAKRDQIFTGRYARAIRPSSSAPASAGSDWVEQEPVHLDTLAAMLHRSPRPVHLLGEGLPYHHKFVPPCDGSIVITPETLWRARASVVAGIGRELAAQNHYADPDRLTPVYVRKPEAEEKWEAVQKG
jgi:tRNA threonylcarbamoyladenosine biosynthesis protein TsaB